MTLAELLSDLRYVAAGYAYRLAGSRDLRVGQVDSEDAMLDAGLAERRGCRIVLTDDGLDVLDACRDVVLEEPESEAP